MTDFRRSLKDMAYYLEKITVLEPDSRSLTQHIDTTASRSKLLKCSVRCQFERSDGSGTHPFGLQLHVSGAGSVVGCRS